MSRGFGDNSKFDATSNAYLNSPFWDKPGSKPELPAKGDVWQHKRTRFAYTVRYVTNTLADTQSSREYPVTVVFEDTRGGVWSLPLDKFLQRHEEGADIV